MRLYVDLETLQLIEAPGFRNPVPALHFKRGDAAQLEVVFLENGTTAAEIGDPATLELQFGIKPRARYDVDYLVHESVWTLPAQGAQDPSYLCAPSFNTTELDSAMQVGSSAGAELSEITLMGEITWREGAGEPTSTRTFVVVVENDVNRGTEGVPEGANPAYPLPSSILTTAAQTFTDPEKAQARGNIDAFPGSQVGTAYLGGDLSGNGRGSGAIDIQSGRINPSEVAWGDYGVALGYSATAGASGVAIGDTPVAYGTKAIAIGSDSESQGQSGISIGNVARSLADYSIAIGYNVTANNGHCVVIGEYASASSDYSVVCGTYAGSNGFSGIAIGYYGYCGNPYGVAMGYSAYVYGDSGVAIGPYSGVDSTESIAIGSYSHASTNDAIAIGPNLQVGVANVAELGSWSNSTTRNGAVRIHGGTGMVAMTIAQASSTYGADLNSTGSEVDGNLAAGMTALRIHPTNKTLHIDWNDAGTIRSINLGTFTP